MSQLQLGAFRLVRPIAEGGMAVVWGGIHTSELPVAVKVLTGGDARDPVVRTMFRNEVRAVAKLAHPGIIAVLDFGEVSGEVAAASEGQLLEGAPYLVMEYAGGGALGKRKRRWSWPAVKRLLTALLDALSHAHARGVVHRDLKPSNILLAGPAGLRGGIKLTDFGIAWVGGQQGQTVAGTLQYMAPEQHSGDWAAFGPWTDLYSLACVAWRIVAGRTPFAHYPGREVARGHLFETAPPLLARFPVPNDLQEWLTVLLHKDPGARFQSAADALEALDALETVEGQDTTEDLGDVEDEDAPFTEGTGSGATPIPPPIGAGEPAGYESPPDLSASLPEDWREEAVGVPMHLRGAGLGLFSLREVPMFGRDAEREVLWRGLRSAQEKGRPRLVLVRGPAGVGKTRLVEWLERRAHEAGGVETLTIRGDDVPQGVAELLGVERLEGPDRGEHVAERLKRVPGADTLVPALLAGLGSSGPSDREAFRAGVVRLLEWTSRTRPSLLVVDDAQDADEALLLANDVASDTEDRRAVLVILVVRDEELAGRPQLEERLRMAVEGTRARELALGPLAPEARQELLQYIGLSGPLAAQVDQRSEGNPQFAIQLVSDWIQQDLLEPGSDGLQLVEGSEAELPEDLQDVWSHRIQRILQPLPAVAVIHIERAAALGMEIDDHEWDRVCDDPVRGRVSDVGLQIRGALVEHMLDARLVEERPRGWAFLQPMLREGLIRSAMRGRRWAGHQKAIVQMLEAARNQDSVRIGLHLLEAGDPERAVEKLLKGLEASEDKRGLVAVSSVLIPLERALRGAGIPEDDARWCRLWRRHSALLRSRGRVDEALPLAERAREVADAAGDLDEWARCTRDVAMTHQEKGDLPNALHILQKAVARMLREGRKGRELARLLAHMVVLGRMMNDLQDAERWASQGLAMLLRTGVPEPSLEGNLLGELAVVANRQGDHVRSLELFEEARPLLEEARDEARLSDLDNNRGDAFKNLGRWAEAEECFVAAEGRKRTLGADPTIPRLNLAICRIHRAAWGEASEILSTILAGKPTRVDRAIAVLCQVVVDAAKHDFIAVERAMGPAVETLRRARFVDPDVAWLAVEGAELAQQGGAIDAACALWFLAREQYAALGDEESVAGATLALSDLDEGRHGQD